MNKRNCGCGERGRHKPTCINAGKVLSVIKKPPRNCGCGERGRHKPTCKLSTTVKKSGNPYKGKTTASSLYHAGYGKPPHLEWYPDKAKQKTVENRISRLVKRYRAFYLTTKSIDKDSNKTEVWFIDGGNWVSIDGKLIGHVKKCLPFLRGYNPS